MARQPLSATKAVTFSDGALFPDEGSRSKGVVTVVELELMLPIGTTALWKPDLPSRASAWFSSGPGDTKVFDVGL